MAERRVKESSSDQDSLDESDSADSEHAGAAVKEEKHSPPVAKAATTPVGVKLKSTSPRRERGRAAGRKPSKERRKKRSRTHDRRRRRSRSEPRPPRKKTTPTRRNGNTDGSQRPPEPAKAPAAVPCSVCQQPVQGGQAGMQMHKMNSKRHLIWQLHHDGMPWNDAVKEANRRKAQEKKEWGRSWSQASRRDWSQARGRSQSQTWQRGRSQSQTWRNEKPQPEQPDAAPEENTAAASSSSSSGDPRLTALASFYESQASLIRNLGGGTSAPK